MTCHCGNCEDHRVDSWKHESVQWTDKTSDEVKDEIFGKPFVKEFAAPPKPSLEELAWESVTKNTQKALDLIDNPKPVGHPISIILYETKEEFPQFKVKIEYEGKILYDVLTGIEKCYLGHVSQDYLIPLRDLLEQLGFGVEERYE